MRLLRLAVLLLRDVGRAEEVVQDSFTAVHQRWDRLGGADVPAYLRQTVVNRSRSRSALRDLSVVRRYPVAALPDEPGADNDVVQAYAAGPSSRRWHASRGAAALRTSLFQLHEETP